MKDKVVKSATGAVDYILSDFDSSGEKRSVKPKIIYGDPDLIRSYDDDPRLGNKNKSTSGVISLRDNEKLTEEQEEKLVERFIELTIPEKFRDTLDLLLVKHEDKGNVEYHFVIPHLTNEGMRINPYAVIGRDHGLSSFAATKAATRILNNEFGFQQIEPTPDSRNGLSNRETKQEKNKPTSLTINTRNKQEITQSLVNLIEKGKINNKTELIDTLTRGGAIITRNNENYLSIKPKEGKKAIRLESGIFANNSDALYTKIRNEAQKNGQQQDTTTYTLEDKAKDEELVKAFHALVVDKYEGKQANMNTLFKEFKAIQATIESPEAKISKAQSPQAIEPEGKPTLEKEAEKTLGPNGQKLPEAPTTQEVKQRLTEAHQAEPKAHTAHIQAQQPGQEQEQPPMANSQGLGGTVKASGVAAAQAALGEAKSNLEKVKIQFGMNSTQYKEAQAQVDAAYKRLNEELARETEAVLGNKPSMSLNIDKRTISARIKSIQSSSQPIIDPHKNRPKI